MAEWLFCFYTLPVGLIVASVHPPAGLRAQHRRKTRVKIWSSINKSVMPFKTNIDFAWNGQKTSLHSIDEHHRMAENEYTASARSFIEHHNVEKSPSYWLKKGQTTLLHHLQRKPIMNVAKNVIIFLGDGLSLASVTAARIYAGQQKGHSGESHSLSFEKFPHVGLSKVSGTHHL